MALTVPLDSAAARQFLAELGRRLAEYPGALERVLVRALNRTLKGASTQALRLITGRYKVKTAEVKRKLAERKATRNRPVIRLWAEGRPIRLSRFGARLKSVRKKRSAYTYEFKGKTISVGRSRPRKYRGVTVQVLRSEGRKIVQGGFLGKPDNGKEMIFRREDGGNKLEVLRGPSLVSFLAQPQVEREILETAVERLERELRSQAKHELSKLI